MGFLGKLFGSKEPAGHHAADTSVPPPPPPLPKPGAPGYEDEIFRLFPDAGQFNHMRVDSPEFGSVHVFTLLEGDSLEAARVRVVACLARPLRFHLEIAEARNAGEGDKRLEGLCRIETDDAAAANALLDSRDVCETIVRLFRAGMGSPRITHYEVSARLPGCSDMTLTPVAQAAGLTSAVVLKMCHYAGERGLLQETPCR